MNGWLAGLGWPEVGQVFRVTREVTTRGITRTEVAYGITSLSRGQANAPQLLSLNRGHWGIENRLFYVLDRTLGEDDCRLITRHAPRNLSIVRRLAVTWLRHLGHANIAAGMRHYTWNTPHLLKCLGIVNY